MAAVWTPETPRTMRVADLADLITLMTDMIMHSDFLYCNISVYPHFYTKNASILLYRYLTLK